MHVVILNHAYDRRLGSPQALLHRYTTLTGWAEGLRAAGAAVSVMQRFHRNATIEHNQIFYQFVKDRFGSQLKISQLPLHLHLRARALKPAVLHINGMLYPLQTRLACTLSPRCPVVVQHHAEMPMTGWRSRIQKWALRSADAFLFTAREAANPWLRKEIIRSARDVFEVMEGSAGLTPMERTAARRRTGLEGKPVFLWVGRLDANKDPLTVLAGFEKLRAQAPEACLYMIYREDALLSEMREAVAKRPILQASVTLIGEVPHADMAWYYNSADYFVLGSHYEGSGYALAEALACGVLPVVTDIPSFRMMTDGGKIGVLWQPGDADGMAQKTAELLRQPLAPWSAAARDFFESRLSFPAIGRRAVEIYRLVLERRKARRIEARSGHRPD